MPIGPFAMFDQIRLDTIVEIVRYWAETLNDDNIRRRVEYLERLDNARISRRQVEPRFLSISISRLCGVWIFEGRQDLHDRSS